MIIYEHPQSERIRVFLRLESLFARLHYFVKLNTPHAYHAAILSIFDMLDITQRPDLKLELLNDLERQRQNYHTFLSSPNVQATILQSVLDRLNSAITDLSESTGKFGAKLRENEWLNAIRNRSSLPGGSCEFDLPSYHQWLHSSQSNRTKDIQEWLMPLNPLETAVGTTLEVLRKGGMSENLVAHHGQYQTSLANSQQEIRLLRLSLDDSIPCSPEISSNKYALSIRFTQQERDQRPRQIARDVHFSLIRCHV